MANVFLNLPVPAGSGVGAWVDVSSQGPERTISVDGGAFDGTIIIEGSNDAEASASPVAVGPFAVPTQRPQTFTASYNFLRVRRTQSSGVGTPTVNVGAPAAIANVFAAMNVPAGDGVGASTDVSAGGDVCTFSVAGAFAGQLLIETSTDGVAFSPTLIFTDGGGVGQTVLGVLQAVRVRRRGSTGGAAPNVSVGSSATTGFTGGGFPGYAGAPPAVAPASAAGVSALVSRGDHTHAQDLVTYTPSAPAMQGTGLVTQTAFAAGVATFGLTAIPAAFPGFGGAPPQVASASAAGAAGTASRSDHTHAQDLSIVYAPSQAAGQASGVLQQTWAGPAPGTATPVSTTIAANLIPTGASTGTGILSTIAGFGQYGALGVGPQVFLDASNVTPAAALLPTQLNVISEASFAISGASIGQYVNATTFGSRFRIIRSRGTFAAPTAVAAQDPMGAINFEGYSGSGYLRTADIAAYIDDTLAVDATHVPINVVVGQAGGQSLNHPIPATQVSQMWAYTGDVVIGFAAQVGALTTGYIWLRSTNDGPPTGVPVAPSRIGVNTGATACIIDSFVTATNQTGRFYGRVNGAWHFTQFDDYSATTARVPFGGATAGTLVDSAFYTFTTATNALVVGGAPGGGTNSGSVKVFSGTNGIAAGGGQFMAVYATDQDATAHAVIGADNGFLGPNLIGWQNGALAPLLVGAGAGQTLTLGYAASTLFGATEAAKIDGTTGTVTLGTLANIAGVTVQQNAAGADTRLGINTVVAGTVHGYPYIPTITATPTGAADVYGNGAAAVTYDTTDHGLWVRSTVGAQWEFVPAANSTLAPGAGAWVTTNLPAGYGTTPKYWSFKGFGGATCVVAYFTNP